MDFLTAYAIYMTVAILVVGLWATRVPHEDIKVVFILAIVWPFTVVAILGFILLQATGYEFDVDTSAGKMYNFRKPTNPKAKGFALCLLGVELQVYKMVK
jgi:hypothetical protein